MSGERKFALNLRIVISIIGTFIVLGLTMQTDNFNFAIILFFLLMHACREIKENNYNKTP